MSINKNIVLDNYTSFGGEAIAAGGFGCVFLPPLKCKGEDRPTGKVVSKLLTKSNATSEFREAKDIQPALLRAREAVKAGTPAIVNIWVDKEEYAPGTKNQTMYK